MGTSVPRFSTIHLHILVISSVESFSSGINKVVISNQTLVSCFKYFKVSKTGCSSLFV